MMQDIDFMKIAYQEALKALEKDEVPIGAVIVKDNQIIAKAHNQRETKQIVTAHAETMVVEKACKELGTWRLEDCTLYTTLEPCLMCSGVIVASRVQRVVYGAKSFRWMSLKKIIDQDEQINTHPEVIGGILKDECSELISGYFRNKR